MANTYLTRTNASAPTNTTKATISCWVKKSGLANNQGIFGVRNTGNNNINVQCGFFNAKWYMWYKDGTTDYYLQDSQRIPRDTHGWYHVVFRWDTTDSTTTDRIRVYVNGENLGQNFDTISNPTQNDDIVVGTNGLELSVGRYTFTGGSTNYFDGLISHFHYCDGYSYGPESFGSTDATTGEWKINTAPNVTYGNNGFFVLKDGNSGTDQSGNGNNLTVGGGTLTKTEDCPDNVFNTFNKLVPGNSTGMEKGNNTLVSGSTQWNGCMTTIPLYKGKWYYECKYITGGNIKFDVVGEQSDFRNFKTLNSAYGGYHGNGYGYQFNNSGNDYIGSNNSFPNWSGGINNSNSGDKIFMVALDLDNGKIWYGADGVWFNDASGNTGNPSTGAHAHQTMTAQHLSEKPHVVTGSVEGSGQTGHWNFGNGYFGTTAVSSAGNNASNLGIFEYDVPTGFTAICTKGLNL